MEGRFWFSNSYAEAAGRFLIACDDLKDAGHNVENDRLEIGPVLPYDKSESAIKEIEISNLSPYDTEVFLDYDA